jgi:hypothetical protein
MAREDSPATAEDAPAPGAWERKYYAPGGGDAWLLYCIFGSFPDAPACSRARYRTEGLPPGVEIRRFERATRPERLDVWFEGYFGRQLDESACPPLVRAAPQMLTVSGTVQDPPTLTYLRDTAGMVSCLLDSGGLAVLDAQILYWWSEKEWTERIWAPAAPVPRHHAVILFSEEEDDPSTEWLHTRGMRKFGRPDLSVHHIPPTLREAVIDLLNRFIELQAFGGIIREGEPIRMKSLPEGMTCHHAGDVDDPDFNNVHVEIRWP